MPPAATSLPLGAELTVNEFLKAHNVEYPLAKGYGMTEVASAATVAAGNVTKPGSVGIPMLNTVVSILSLAPRPNCPSVSAARSASAPPPS